MLWIIVLCLTVICILLLLFIKRQNDALQEIRALTHDLGNVCSVMQQASALCAKQENIPYAHMLQGQSQYGVLLCRMLCAMCMQNKCAIVSRRLGDVGESVRETCMQLDAWLQGRGIVPEVEILGNCTARFDALALKRILYNLIKNAAEAMPSGGRICIRADGESDSGRVTVTVMDTGTGMDEAQLKHIFRKGVTNKNDTRVHGLGLPCARRLAKLHGGNLDVSSQKDVGSSFSLSLPR